MRLPPALLFALPVASAIGLECPSDVPCCGVQFAVDNLTVAKDIPYGTAYSERVSDYIPLLLDAYAVQTTENLTLPVIVVVHGGGFTYSEPNQGPSRKSVAKIQNEAGTFALHGFLAVSIEYRRYNGDSTNNKGAQHNPFGENTTVIHPVQDVKTAVRFLRANPTFLHELGTNVTVDTENIGVYGCSAGGVTVSHAYLTDTGPEVGNFSNFSSSVKAVISGSGGLVRKSLWNPPLLPCASIPPYLTIFNSPDALDPMGSAAEYTDELISNLGAVTGRIQLGLGHCPPFYAEDSPVTGNKVIVDMVSWFLRSMNVSGCRLPAGGGPSCVANPCLSCFGEI